MCEVRACDEAYARRTAAELLGDRRQALSVEVVSREIGGRGWLAGPCLVIFPSQPQISMQMLPDGKGSTPTLPIWGR